MNVIIVLRLLTLIYIMLIVDSASFLTAQFQFVQCKLVHARHHQLTYFHNFFEHDTIVIL